MWLVMLLYVCMNGRMRGSKEARWEHWRFHCKGMDFAGPGGCEFDGHGLDYIHTTLLLLGVVRHVCWCYVKTLLIYFVFFT